MENIPHTSKTNGRSMPPLLALNSLLLNANVYERITDTEAILGS